jgi:hypothetical protein
MTIPIRASALVVALIAGTTAIAVDLPGVAGAVGAPGHTSPVANVLTAPTAPTDVAATSSGGHAVTVSWAAPTSTGGSGITGYSVTSSPVVAPPSSCTETTQLSCSFSGLTRGTLYTFSVTASNASGTGPAAMASATPVAVFAGKLSSNWSGYVVHASSAYTQISASWTVPTLNCNSTPDGRSSAWVGTGGAGTGSGLLLQTGTGQRCVSGTQVSTGWSELLPAANTVFKGFEVDAGDSMTGTVLKNSSGKWATFLTDHRTGLTGKYVVGVGWSVSGTSQGTSVGTSYAGGLSAEWVFEDPTDGTKHSLYPFADFQRVTFTGLEANSAAPALTSTDAEALYQSSTFLSVPSGDESSSFSCRYMPTGYVKAS